LGFDTVADGAEDRLRHGFFGISLLFVLGVDEGALTILADEDFVRHRYILHVIKTRLNRRDIFLWQEYFFNHLGRLFNCRENVSGDVTDHFMVVNVGFFHGNDHRFSENVGPAKLYARSN